MQQKSKKYRDVKFLKDAVIIYLMLLQIWKRRV